MERNKGFRLHHSDLLTAPLTNYSNTPSLHSSYHSNSATRNV
jgi:hypothetical protein